MRIYHEDNLTKTYAPLPLLAMSQAVGLSHNATVGCITHFTSQITLRQQSTMLPRVDQGHRTKGNRLVYGLEDGNSKGNIPSLPYTGATWVMSPSHLHASRIESCWTLLRRIPFFVSGLDEDMLQQLGLKTTSMWQLRVINPEGSPPMTCQPQEHSTRNAGIGRLLSSHRASPSLGTRCGDVSDLSSEVASLVEQNTGIVKHSSQSGRVIKS